MSKKTEKPGVIVLVAIYTQVRSLFMTLADANFFMLTNFSFASTHALGMNRASGSKPSAVTKSIRVKRLRQGDKWLRQARKTGLRFNGRSMRWFYRYHSRLIIFNCVLENQVWQIGTTDFVTS